MAQQSVELILFRQLATSLAMPVFLVDEGGDLVFLNEAAEQLLGVRLDEMDHLPLKTWSIAFRPRTPEGAFMPIEELPLVRAVRDRRPAHGVLAITDRDGVERTIEITAFPLEGGRGRLIGGVAMFWEPERP
jgi:PAS domain S-box-containing protein